MPDEVRLWRIGPDESLNAIQRASLDLEARLQKWLARDISILDPELLVIGQEVETDFGGFIDLLCIDVVGNLVVIELKRDKTPREITAQVLDYGSWVADLSHKGVTSIAEAHLGETGFERAFRDRFKTDVPETLNGDHRLLVVGSQIDDSTERVIKYLSEHDVNINAATFQYFRAPDGAEFLARVFLIEPTAAELRSRVKGTSKRLPNLTYDELEGLAEASGVQDLYRHAVSAFASSVLQRHTTRSSIGFTALLDGRRKAVISLLPSRSRAVDGLAYQLYKHRFAALTGLTEADVEDLAPASRDHWAYVPDDPDFEGFEGYIETREEIDRLATALSGGRLGM